MSLKTIPLTPAQISLLFDALDPKIKYVIRSARFVAGEQHARAYLVGGFVRDLLLGVDNFDVDIAVEGEGIRFAEALSARVGARCIRHKRFGTATIVTAGRLKTDVASSRKELYPEPASLPIVRPGDIRDDLARRDFSINAMAVSINADDFGAFLDLYGGRADLKKKHVSVLHEASFIDDPTRILRAIRFEQRLGFSMSTDTMRCLRRAVRARMLHALNLHRVRDEIILMLQEQEPAAQMRRLAGLCGFSFLHPAITFSAKTGSLFRSIAFNLQWFSRNFPHRRQLDRWLLYFIALLDPLSSTEARHLIKKLALRRGEEKRLLDYKKFGPRAIRALQKKTIAPSSIFGHLEPLSYEVILLLMAKANSAVFRKRVDDFFRHYNGIRHSVSGKDLSELGMIPGPCYAKVLRALLDAKLDGKVRSRAEEIAFVRRLKNSV